MPYYTRKGTGKDKGKTCVYKRESDKKVGCTSGSIKKYLAALHMHADESIQRRVTMKLTKSQLKQIIKEEIDQTVMIQRLESIVKDVDNFIKDLPGEDKLLFLQYLKKNIDLRLDTGPEELPGL